MKIKNYTQKTLWTCGPAAAHIALAALNIHISEEKLAKEMNCTKTRGTEDKEFVSLAKERHLIYQTKSHVSTIADLKNALKEKYVVIICYFDKIGKYGHYAVIKKINKNRISLVDPSEEKEVSYGLDYFRTIWHGTNTPARWFIGIKK